VLVGVLAAVLGVEVGAFGAVVGFGFAGAVVFVVFAELEDVFFVGVALTFVGLIASPQMWLPISEHTQHGSSSSQFRALNEYSG
jgi:hypothetical protein